MVKALVLSVEIRLTQTDMRLPPGFSLDELSDRALRAARNARKLLPDKVQGQDAFTAAVLQDCGLLVLMSRLPEVFREIVSRAQGDNKAFDEIEREVLGVTHGEIGAYLLGIWGLPYSIVEAVAYHHSPQKTNSVGLDVTCAVHIASALAGEELLGSSPGCNLTRVTLDESHLAKLGLLPQVPQWRAAAAPVDPSRRA
jgi:HD-like signal output (HDOD) protein